VDLIFADKVTLCPPLAHLYTEKFIYMPNHFFRKGRAVQKEVKPPTTYEYTRAKIQYKIGHGSPKESQCLAKGIKKPKFVF
jgi:protein O-GlcNAc transferase